MSGNAKTGQTMGQAIGRDVRTAVNEIDGPAKTGKGGKAMKTTMKAAALVGLLMMVTGRAWALADASNDSDQIIITITPNVDRGVEIDTGSVILDMGTVDLYTTTQTVSPATVTILGTLAGQELDLTGSIEGGAIDWTFDTSPTTVGETGGEEDALAAYVLFSDTSLSLAPTASDFADGTALASFSGGSPQRAGSASGDGTKHEMTGAANVDMDDKDPNDTAHLWIFLRLPSITSTSNAQEVTFTLTAVDAS